MYDEADIGFTIENLAFSYGNIRILEDINIHIPQGRFVCLLGTSGCGKTTLLRILAGLETVDTGKISWNGEQITGPSQERGMVFQEYSLFPWYTLKENIVLAIRQIVHGLSKKEAREYAEDYLDLVGLSTVVHKYPFELSGGMRQRGALARALALGSRVLLMDEPFGALDPVNRAKLQDLLINIWSGNTQRKTIVFVTHDVEEALYLGDEVILLGSSPGRILTRITVPFGRPRERRKLFNSQEFIALSERIADSYHQDVFSHLESGSAIEGIAEGI